MNKVKFKFNPHTLKFEKIEVPLRVRLLKTFGFIGGSLFTAFIILLIIHKYFPSENENILSQQNKALINDLRLLQQRTNELETVVDEIEKRDNEVYRAIFEAEPVPDTQRIKLIEMKKEVKLVQGLSEMQLVKNIKEQLFRIDALSIYQQKSFGEISELIKNKQQLLQAIPAIQPVSNKDLNRIASGFGYRIDPVYKVTKFHAGLDFTAAQGTPIYATANGRVEKSEFNNGGYGNHVVINHGYGIQTLYGHMYKTNVRSGQTVKRGEVIGYVGNTGKSTGPHCHYEVHRNGTPVDPLYYFYNDITPSQYDVILKKANANTQSLD